MIVVTGLSGSGKSTLAFDVVFAEGQRRYLESLRPTSASSCTILPRPDVDLVAGIPPTIAIEQRLSRGGRKSTVATVTEVAHYLRLLFAKVGVQHCVALRRSPIRSLPRGEIAARLAERVGARDVALLAPVVRGARASIATSCAPPAACATPRSASTEASLALEPLPELDRYREHDVDVVVGRVAGGRGPER